MSFTVRTLSEDPKPRSKRKLLRIPQWLTFWRTFLPASTNKAERTTGILQRTFIVLGAILGSLIVLVVLLRILLSLQLFSLSGVLGMFGSDLPTDEHGHINILLLGQGDKSHQGQDLTDTIIIASIDPKKTNSVVMVSLPRDTLVTTQYFGEQSIQYGRRINSVYRDIKYSLQADGLNVSAAEAEALTLFEAEIEQLSGLDIFGTVKVDFIGFERVIDSLGGLEIDVPQAIYDPEYPDNNYGYQTFSISAGMQTLDGATALKYARSRHTTSDFSRSARQQQIIAALAQKVKDEGLLGKPSKLTELAQIAAEHYQSTVKLTEMISLASIGKDLNRDAVLSYQLNDRTGYTNNLPQPAGLLYPPPREDFGGAAVLLPVSIPTTPITWKMPQAFIQFVTQYRELLLTKAPISVLNAGAISGEARLLANELTRHGLNVDVIDNAENITDLEQSFITLTIPTNADGDEIYDPKTFEPLANMLALPIEERSDIIATDRRRLITIVLGADFTYTPLQDLL